MKEKDDLDNQAPITWGTPALAVIICFSAKGLIQVIH